MIGRIGLVAAALLLAGCGGSSDEPEPKVSAAPTQVSLADTCPKIQDALDAAFEGKGDDTTGADYQVFADGVSSLLAVVDPKGEPLLDQLWIASKNVATASKSGMSGSGILDFKQEWLSVMSRVTDTCQQLGAPLS